MYKSSTDIQLHAAKMRVTYELLADALGFPPGTVVRAIYNEENQPPGVVTIVVLHEDLPEGLWGDFVPLITPTMTITDPPPNQRNWIEFDWNLDG
jgi:hypothetical protein